MAQLDEPASGRSVGKRERLIRELITRTTGLDRAVLIDAYRELVQAHLVSSAGRQALSDLDADYPAQDVFGATRNRHGRYAYAFDSASDMLEAELALNDALDADARSSLQRVLERLVEVGALDEPTGSAIARARSARVDHTGASIVWAPYAPVSESSPAVGREPFPVDPDLLDRATLGHKRTQNMLGELAARLGYEALRVVGDPQVDVAWAKGDHRTIVEVKTINVRNEAQQLRLGLGQLFDYHDQLTASGWVARLVLATDREPSDPRWARICARYGVDLVWPETFESVLGGEDD